MIISHKHHYLFIELPHTASTAISQELCELYDGRPILHKHAHYYEFLEIASAEEKTFFTFAGVRNPLDVVVTLYFKRKTNHQDFFTNPKYWQINGGHLSIKSLKEYRFIVENKASFRDYLFKYYRIPYDSWGSPRPENFDFVIRYENLQSDFTALLKRLNIEPIRPLPLVNKTRQKPNNFWDYYTPEMREHVRSVFGPHMKIWGYKVPDSWGAFHISPLSSISFNLLGLIRKNIVWGPTTYASLFQVLRNQYALFYIKNRSHWR